MFSQVAEFSFDKTIKNYRVINEGDTLHGYFVYANKGKKPLSIERYSVECHCTKVILPKKPTQPNEVDTIYFTFDSNGKYYQQKRSIMLFSKDTRRELHEIFFKVYVNPKEEQ